MFRPVGGVFTREFGWARDHLHSQASAFAQELCGNGGISAAGAASTLGAQGVVRPGCGLNAARKQQPQ
jgi:hypothetical protein